MFKSIYIRFNRCLILKSSYRLRNLRRASDPLQFGWNTFPKVCSSKMSSITYASSVELQERSPQPARSYTEPISLYSSQNGVSHDTRVVQQHLEPADSGPAAWRLLGAAFVFEALFWGKTFHINFLMKPIVQYDYWHINFKDFLFPLEFFRITTPVFRSLPTIRIFLL